MVLNDVGEVMELQAWRTVLFVEWIVQSNILMDLKAYRKHIMVPFLQSGRSGYIICQFTFGIGHLHSKWLFVSKFALDAPISLITIWKLFSQSTLDREDGGWPNVASIPR
jgi:hypothetical protein